MSGYNRYYKKPILNKIFYFSLGWLAMVSKLIPKQKGLYVFGSMNGYAVADNAKYLYLQTKGRKYFITRNKSLAQQSLGTNERPLYAWSVKGMLVQLFAEKSFYTHGIYDFIPSLIWGSEKHNLWHGVPLKEIGPAADWRYNSRFLKKIKALFYRRFNYMYYMACDYVYCPFKERVEDYKRYFSISKPIVMVRKQPRNSSATVNMSSRKVLYAPTFRDMRSSLAHFQELLKVVGFYDPSFQVLLEEYGITFVIRPHPIDLARLDGADEINEIVDRSPDLYEHLGSYQAVITDYSSIYYDCLERNIECYFLAPDLDEYNQIVGINSELFKKIKSEGKDNLLDAVTPIVLNAIDSSGKGNSGKRFPNLANN